MSKSVMTSNDIEAALQQKYSTDKTINNRESNGNDEWVMYTQFYTDAAYKYHYRICDFLAFRLWGGFNIIGHEIKTSRSDFKIDAGNFRKKQRATMEFTTEFYYVCPWGLIQTGEVPEGTGLMWVNSGMKCIVKKQAPYRDKDSIPIGVFKSFIARQARGSERFTCPMKLMGKDITDKEFNQVMNKRVKIEVDKEVEYQMEKKFELGIAKKVKELNIQKTAWVQFLEDAFPYNVSKSIKEGDQKAIEYARRIAKFVSDGLNRWNIKTIGDIADEFSNMAEALLEIHKAIKGED